MLIVLCQRIIPDKYSLSTPPNEFCSECGLTTTHTQAVTVQDTIAPVFVEVCPTNVPFNICTDGAITPAATLTATDNCENVAVTYNCCFDASADAVTRTWSVSDSCGNSATDCVQTIAIDPTCGA